MLLVVAAVSLATFPLTLATEGGAPVKATQIEPVECPSQPVEDGKWFRADWTWNVAGSVKHWGHIHQRTDPYHTPLEVQPVDGTWKITGMELLSQARR